MMRIKALASITLPNPLSVADIGTDHGYYPLELRKRGIESIIYCIDNKKKPLDAAMRNLVKYENIEYLLGDGLTPLSVDVDVICIAGMGGALIKEILAKRVEYAKRAKQIVLAPNNDWRSLRAYLHTSGFWIQDEININEKGKYYPIISCFYCEKKQELAEIDYVFGPCLRKTKDDVFRNYWSNYEKAILTKPNAISKNHHIREKLDMLQRILSEE